MGNCVAAPSAAAARRLNISHGYMKDDEPLRIVKADGKVLEYGTTMSVIDLLSEFEGFAVGVSKHASHLPPDHELQTGKVYFLLPLIRSGHGMESLEDSSRSCKRIKVVLTKQQLQELLLKKVDVEDVLLTLKEEQEDGNLSYSTSWKPLLETIQEEC